MYFSLNAISNKQCNRWIISPHILHNKQCICWIDQTRNDEWQRPQSVQLPANEVCLRDIPRSHTCRTAIVYECSWLSGQSPSSQDVIPVKTAQIVKLGHPNDLRKVTGFSDIRLPLLLRLALGRIRRAVYCVSKPVIESSPRRDYTDSDEFPSSFLMQPRRHPACSMN
jgi:hypothetical protein